MGLFNKQRDKRETAKPDANRLIAEFEARIDLHDDLMYGVALFFEGISQLLAGADALIETYRKQCRNIIQSGKVISHQARLLLRQAREDPSKAPFLDQFKFSSFGGHTQPEEMEKRARILVETYRVLFPERPRSREFTAEETFQLIEHAAAAFEGQQSAPNGKTA